MSVAFHIQSGGSGDLYTTKKSILGFSIIGDFKNEGSNFPFRIPQTPTRAPQAKEARGPTPMHHKKRSCDIFQL